MSGGRKFCQRRAGFAAVAMPACAGGTVPMTCRPSPSRKARQMPLRLILMLLGLLAAGPALALCQGRDLLAALPSVQARALETAVANAPFASGNHWRASRDGSTVNVIGTFHIFDRRMPGRMANLELVVRAADAIYLEATDAEMAEMQVAITRDPDLLFVPRKGATLPESLNADEWTSLSDEMRARGIPPFMAAKFRPWYVTMLLAVPPCAMEALATEREGLDRLVMDAAEANGVPLRALEPFDTVFRIFGAMSEAEQLDMVRATLPLASQAEDFFATMTEAYLAEEHRRIWEFSRLLTLATPGADPEKMAEDFALMEEQLLYGRNRAWMKVILDAAEGRHIVVAVGAAHLSGDEGLLRLLELAGYRLERQRF